MACGGLVVLLLASISPLLRGPSVAEAAELPAWLQPPPKRDTRAVNYDPKPGLLFVELDQVTLTTYCTDGVTSHSSQNCGIVSEDTTFPAWGDPSSHLAVTNALEQVLAPYDLVITTERPDHYVNYGMIVLTDWTYDTSGAETCVLAEPACDGAQRNGIALAVGGTATCTGPDPIVQVPFAAGTLAGLEGTGNAADPMYFPPTFSWHAVAFQNDCATLTVDPSCGQIHRAYCDDDETVQNSHQELLGVYGPRTPDTEDPLIAFITPQDGAVFQQSEAWMPTALLDENSNAIAVKWTLETDTGEVITKCNNRGAGCDDTWDYITTPVEGPWDFFAFAGAPAGTYVLIFEAQDMYGNRVEEVVRVEVEGEGGEDFWGPDDDGDPGDDGWPGDDGDPGDDGWPGDDGGPGGGTGETDGDGSAQADTRGCACTTRPSPAPTTLALPLLALVATRRRTLVA